MKSARAIANGGCDEIGLCGALKQRPCGALGRGPRASTAAAHTAAAALLLPGELAEVFGQQTAHLHAKHARLNARKEAVMHAERERGRGERGERAGKAPARC